MAEGIPYWDYDWEPWNRLKVNGKAAPGLWMIESGNVKRVLDIKKSPGRDGAIIKDMGYENGALVLVGQIGDELEGQKQWVEMQQLITELRLTQKGKQRKPVEIEHPMALYLGITKVNVTEIDVPRIENGILTQTIRVLEFIPKTSKTGTDKKTSASLEDELRRNFTGDFAGTNAVTAGARLSEIEKKNLAEANREYEQGVKQGKIPAFRATAPQYNGPLAQ